MPNPKRFIDDDHIYVQAHVKRKRRDSDLFGFLLKPLLILLVIALVIWFLRTFWVFVSIIAVITLAIYIPLNWKKWKARILKYRVNKQEAKMKLEQEIRDYERKLKHP